LLDPLVKELDRLAGQQRPTIRWTKAVSPSQPAVDACLLGSAPADRLLPIPQGPESPDLSTLRIVETVQPLSGQPAILVSYAWGNSASEAGRQRAQVVDGLCKACETEGWQVVRDTSMQYGDCISKFMKPISRADLILVVISEKYLRSEYCMAELHGIYQRSLGEQDEFLRRVIVFTLDDAKIGTLEGRADHADYWKAAFEKIEPRIQSLGWQDYRRYKAMKNWYNDVGDILATLNDVLSPHTFEDIVADNYQALRTMLKRQKASDAAP
jgi:internalin A